MPEHQKHKSAGRRAVTLGMLAMLAAIAAGCRNGDVATGTQPAGGERTGTTGVLETGAAALQDVAPVGQINVYLVGFHPMKDDPAEQMESHHYCNQVNEDFAQ